MPEGISVPERYVLLPLNILFCRQNEDEDFRVLVELVYQILAVLHRGLAVQAEVPMTPDLEILLHDVHHHGELREDEDPVSVTLHHRQHVVQ